MLKNTIGCALRDQKSLAADGKHAVDEKPLTLTDAELVELTRKTRPSAQQRALRFMGIEHRTRPDGSVVVDRAHYLWVMHGAKGRKPKAQRSGINWDD